MVNIRIKHLRKVRAKGAVYWYHRKTGERLPDDETARVCRALEINEGLEAPGRRVKYGSVEAVTNVYKASPIFKGLADRTQQDYALRLRAICKHWGDHPITSIQRKHVRARQDQLGDKPATATGQ